MTDPAAAVLAVHEAGRRVGDRWLWQDVSFDLKPGSRLGVAGPSGSGKTLLLRALAGLDPLDRGTIRYRGTPLSRWSMPDYRASVVYLAQTPALREGTVEDNLRAVFNFHVHDAKQFDERAVRRRLEQLGRDGSFLQRSVQVLSGGERQIAAFLRALQLQPDVLLLDEPTANLDARAASQVEALVAAWLQEAPERAAVWTSHRTDQLDRMTDTRLDLTRFADGAG